MNDVRPAQKGDINRLKKIWKACFDDPDPFIQFYFYQRFRPDETVVLLKEKEIAAMLTLIPIHLVTPDFHRIPAAMFYAIATHPDEQHQGLATQLIEFSNQRILKEQKSLSVLVPAEPALHDFYRRQGYREGFSTREIHFTKNMIDSWVIDPFVSCQITPFPPDAYTQRRDNFLRGTLYIAYNAKEIEYQKKLSQLSGADIYALDCGGSQGCAAIERVTADYILIKELLIADALIPLVLQTIARQWPAKKYGIRLPVHAGHNGKGSIRSFGMFKTHEKNLKERLSETSGYLGLAFD